MSSLAEQFNRIRDAVRELMELVGTDSEIIKSPVQEPMTEEIAVDHDNVIAGLAPAVSIPDASLDVGVDEAVPHVISPPTIIIEEAAEVVLSATSSSCSLLHAMWSTEYPSQKGATLASVFTPAATPTSLTATVVVVPLLAAPAASGGTLDSSHNGSGLGMLPLTPWSVSASFTESPGLWPAQLCWLSVLLVLDTKSSSRCSTTCLINHTELFMYMSIVYVIPSIMRPRQGLRPRPWPSFIGDQAAHGKLEETMTDGFRVLGTRRSSSSTLRKDS
ncbi:uncharacterized protein [Triticum aestivum]|uniref:uncharacterized protein isoform X2 n=1 Tax=Triticum aestivum TaxID=4565 RepID=UPI001D0203CD|nr:uncharacterized protein LOC123149515 isoform X2 [Triticum aestivum]